MIESDLKLNSLGSKCIPLLLLHNVLNNRRNCIGSIIDCSIVQQKYIRSKNTSSLSTSIVHLCYNYSSPLKFKMIFLQSDTNKEKHACTHTLRKSERERRGKEREPEWERKSSNFWTITQMPKTSRAGLSWNQKPGTLSGSPFGIPILELPSAVLQTIR